MGVPEYWPRNASGRHGVRVACDGESAGNASSVRNNDARLKIALIDNASSPIKGERGNASQPTDK
ncbi:hypothetical protein PspLS_06260 [Pyricularia sp. CBS 133598]|nr:hypothetical protein PspLS_06260 [Pyricularia sp. CBS 133598]